MSRTDGASLSHFLRASLTDIIKNWICDILLLSLEAKTVKGCTYVL